MKLFRIGSSTIPFSIVFVGMGIGILLSGLASAVAAQSEIGTIAKFGAGLIHGTRYKSFKQNNIEGVNREIRKAPQFTKEVLAVNIMSVLSDFSDLDKKKHKLQTLVQDVLMLTKDLKTAYNKECIKSCNPKTTNYCIVDVLLSACLGRLNSGFAFSGANEHKTKSITAVKQVFDCQIKKIYSSSNTNN